MDIVNVGIGVSKDRLDVAIRPSGETLAVERNVAGLDCLKARLPLAGESSTNQSADSVQ